MSDAKAAAGIRGSGLRIELRDLSKAFGPFRALDRVSLSVAPGELVALLGPSGSGKTTLLRILAGLERPDAGTILFDGRDAMARSARERRVGFVFQHYALFRHMTVRENVGFGLRVRPRGARPADSEIRARVDALLQLVQLEWLADRYPSQLSGGQRQRVALARALAVEPKVLLLDEPFGSLDARVRQELRRWLRRLHDEIHITSVFVTHDQEEALEVADRVVVMNDGRIEQIGTPEEVYDHPINPFVYNFLGNVNLFRGRIEGGKAYIGDVVVDLPDLALPESANALVYLRPHELDVERQPTAGARFHARVQQIHRAGPMVRVHLLTDWGDLMQVAMTQERFQALQLETGAEVFVSARGMKVFPDEPPASGASS